MASNIPDEKRFRQTHELYTAIEDLDRELDKSEHLPNELAKLFGKAFLKSLPFCNVAFSKDILNKYREAELVFKRFRVISDFINDHGYRNGDIQANINFTKEVKDAVVSCQESYYSYLISLLDTIDFFRQYDFKTKDKLGILEVQDEALDKVLDIGNKAMGMVLGFDDVVLQFMDTQFFMFMEGKVVRVKSSASEDDKTYGCFPTEDSIRILVPEIVSYDTFMMNVCIYAQAYEYYCQQSTDFEKGDLVASVLKDTEESYVPLLRSKHLDF